MQWTWVLMAWCHRLHLWQTVQLRHKLISEEDFISVISFCGSPKSASAGCRTHTPKHMHTMHCIHPLANVWRNTEIQMFLVSYLTHPWKYHSVWCTQGSLVRLNKQFTSIQLPFFIALAWTIHLVSQRRSQSFPAERLGLDLELQRETITYLLWSLLWA